MDDDWLAEQFDANRTRLRAVAYRMLGSVSEAEDAVQETWLKLSRSDSESMQNLGGWLTTALARVCLDMLRTRRSRREDPLEAAPDAPGEGSLDEDLALADATGSALMVVLETLVPAERVAFVLHDLFDLSFEDIGRILERTPLWRPASSPAAQGAGCGERKPLPPTWRGTVSWSRHFSRHRETGISIGCSRCCPLMSCSEPTSWR